MWFIHKADTKTDTTETSGKNARPKWVILQVATQYIYGRKVVKVSFQWEAVRMTLQRDQVSKCQTGTHLFWIFFCQTETNGLRQGGGWSELLWLKYRNWLTIEPTPWRTSSRRTQWLSCDISALVVSTFFRILQIASDLSIYKRMQKRMQWVSRQRKRA